MSEAREGVQHRRPWDSVCRYRNPDYAAERTDAASMLDVFENERPATIRHGRAFGPAGCNIITELCRKSPLIPVPPQCSRNRHRASWATDHSGQRTCRSAPVGSHPQRDQRGTHFVVIASLRARLRPFWLRIARKASQLVHCPLGHCSIAPDFQIFGLAIVLLPSPGGTSPGWLGTAMN